MFVGEICHKILVPDKIRCTLTFYAVVFSLRKFFASVKKMCFEKRLFLLLSVFLAAKKYIKMR